MKQLVFLFMASVAMTFVSCNCGTSKCETPANDSDSVAVVDSMVVDSTVVDSTVVDSLVVEADSVVAE
jgi:hypothetical protein